MCVAFEQKRVWIKGLPDMHCGGNIFLALCLLTKRLGKLTYDIADALQMYSQVLR
jgi:hypothetical protein